MYILYNIKRNWITDYIVDMSTGARQGKQIDNISDIGMMIKYYILFYPRHMFSCYTILSGCEYAMGLSAVLYGYEQ